ncbi:MAG: oligopeptide transporter, OPT family, partial [Thermoplasmata archaeon]
MMPEKFKPYISADTILPELSKKSILLGIILAIVMAAANAYLGLKAGMTVSASIPAAVISMAILKGVLKSGNILENNIVQTIASAGEALAAGVIFTFPALLLMGVWKGVDPVNDWQNYVILTSVAAMGGVLGVLFTISLRRIFIVEQELPYPEGVACAEVLKAGDKGDKSVSYVFTALGIGAGLKFIEAGLGAWRSKIEGVLPIGRSGIAAGCEISPALFAVGYIIGAEISFLVFLGGAIAWFVLVPILALVYPLEGANLLDSLYNIWYYQVRYVGVGAMIVGGMYTLFKMRDAITKGVKESFASIKEGSAKVKETIRTELDMSAKSTYALTGLLVIPIFAAYFYLSNSMFIAAVSAIVMLFAAFFFSAIAGYIAGIVGSSNNPISGVTIATLIFAALLLVGLGAKGTAGIIATIGIAAVVCCAAAIAGDNLQDLKTGYLVGSTPRSQQIALIIGVLVSALVIAPVIAVLNSAYGIGSKDLPAPQAGLMAMVTTGIFTGNMNWPFVIIGAEFALLFILLRKPVMPIAVGIYLPFTLSVPILFGGLARLGSDIFITQKFKKENNLTEIPNEKKQILEEKKEAVGGKGVL